MSAYQKVKEIQDEVELITGVRPHIYISFYAHYSKYNDDKAASIRNVLVADSNEELKPLDMHLGTDDQWTAFQAFDHANNVSVCAHGPAVAVAKEEEAHAITQS